MSESDDRAARPLRVRSSSFRSLWLAPYAVLRKRARRGVGLYDLSLEAGVGAVAIGFFVGIPISLFLAVLPFWENYARLPWVAATMRITEPAIASLDAAYRAAGMPDFPLERFFVAISTMAELLLLVSPALLSFRKMRKAALMVWICYPRELLLRSAILTGLTLAACWFLFFYNWVILDALVSRGSYPAGRLLTYAFIALPFDAFAFGHIVAISLAGGGRQIEKLVRRRKAMARSIP